LTDLLNWLVASAQQIVIPADMVLGSSELICVFTECGAFTGKEVVICGSGGIGHFGLACGIG
jgi:hypothetical protein